MRKWIRVMLVSVVLAMPAGCRIEVDPLTGEKTYSLDPNAAQQVEEGAEATVTILGALAALWPGLLPIAAGAAGILATWRKVKPKLTKAQTEAKMFHSVASCTALGIEEFKKAYPKEWDQLKTELELIKNKILDPADRLKIENVIRGLTGKPPKE